MSPRLPFILFCTAALAGPPISTRASAHRGDNKNAPENTVPALASAARKGAHQIEFDVKFTADRRLVLMHDATVDRTTNGKGRVAELTFEQIRSLDAGKWFAAKFAGVRVPAFEEALAAIPRGILLNVHLSDTPGLAEAVAQVIVKQGRVGDSVLACTPAQAEAARRVAPQIRYCNMSGQRTDHRSYVEDTLKAKADFIQLRGGVEGVAEAVERLHGGGVKVNYYSAQDEESIRRLIEARVDYILTDDLDLLLAILARRGVAPSGARGR
ncbi:MAG: glycerophosphodiester phosphodiesterase [Acidobacteria bacterium]|nr:glycerophosphodiester phosphodiesterase [Acidobacteriota bacterium]